MFDMAHELGSLLAVRNRLGLTPLTLAAKLARRDMFFHILKIQREVYWQLGNTPTLHTHRTLTV
jgi:transient receptor potential cation channel subfamily V protein 5